MKNLQEIFFIALLCLASFCANADDKLPAQLEARVDALSTLLKDSYATEFSRDVHWFTNKHLGNVAIVVLTLEGFGGGNGSSQYLAVFNDSAALDAETGDLPYYILIDFIQAGSKGWRYIDSHNISVSYNSADRELVIVTPFSSYVPDDPLCCPSKKGSSTYRLDIQSVKRLTVRDN